MSKYAKYDSTPPHDNAEVAQIMAERGVGRRRAYAIVRDQRRAGLDVESVSSHQRVAVLAALINEPACGSDTTDLLAVLHRAGIKIDMHDTVKTLWSLQKTRSVMFRERNGGRTLGNIRVTDEGLALYESLTNWVPKPDPCTHEIDFVKPDEPAIETAVAAVEVAATTTDHYDAYPAISDLRVRARKAKRLQEAARILEEVGEDDIALSLMGKTDFSRLETEVIEIMNLMEE